MMQLVVAGLGRAGSGYGAADRGLGIHRSHIGAALKTGRFEVAGVVDPDPSMIASARDLWGTPLAHVANAAHLDELPRLTPDVIALATPPGDRVEQVRAALRHRPRLLLVEKPLALTSAATEEIVALCDAASVMLRVNFHRAADAEYRRLRSKLREVPLRANALIGGGLLNYGSHLVDLMLDWFGPVSCVAAPDALRGAGDPVLDFRMTMEAGFDCVVQSVPSAAYDLFELDILFPSSRLVLANGGVEKTWYGPFQGLHYPSYSQLAPVERTVALVGGLDTIYCSIADALSGQGAPIGCDGTRALAGAHVLDSVRRAAVAGCPVSIPFRHSGPRRPYG